MNFQCLFLKSLLIIILYFAQSIICQEQYDEIDKIINSAINDKAFPGAVVLVQKDGSVLFEKAYGNFTYESNSPQVTTKTIYDLASLTKVVATTTAAMICIDSNMFSLDDLVVKHLPEFNNNDKSGITIKNLLLHNSGLPAWKKFYENYSSEEEVLTEIYNSKLEYEPGTKTIYSDFGIITLGQIIEKVTNQSLDKFCEDKIFNPLRMHSTFYNPPDSIKKNCAPTEIDNYWRNRTLQGEVHDETSAMLNGVAGHAGLFSTANDISKFMNMIINKGCSNDIKLIKSKTIEQFTKKYSESSSRALGWDTKSEKGSSSGDFFSSNSFGHTGFTGTSIWADPERDLVVIFLTNRVHPTRDNRKISEVRPKLHNAIIKSFFN